MSFWAQNKIFISLYSFTPRYQFYFLINRIDFINWCAVNKSHRLIESPHVDDMQIYLKQGVNKGSGPPLTLVRPGESKTDLPPLPYSLCCGLAIACTIKPDLGGGKLSVTWGERFETPKDLIPVLIIFVVVIGSIYAGLATPTESAALGVLASLLLALRYKAISIDFFKQVFEGTMRTSSMIMLILISANFLNFILDSIGLAETLYQFINNLGASPLYTLLVVIALYIVLGFFVETLSLMVITVLIVAPILVNLGYDPVWFGILLILLIEMALITPPVGLNLYVVQGVRRTGSIVDVMIGAIPFVFMIAIIIVLLIIYPEIALYCTQFVM